MGDYELDEHLLGIMDPAARAVEFRRRDPYLCIVDATLYDAAEPVSEFRLARSTAEMICAGWLRFTPGTRPPVVPTALMGVPVVIDDAVPLDRLRVVSAGQPRDVAIPVAFSED